MHVTGTIALSKQQQMQPLINVTTPSHPTGPASPSHFLSSDSLILDESNPNTAFATPEPLNEVNVSGVPPHELKLKSNTLAMLVRNLNFSAGLVNGQTCVLHAIYRNSHVIQAELLTEQEPHPIVFIPRINFTAACGKRGISFSRAQFPLRTAYAMTINKSQGQTLSSIGLDLRSSAFAHGRLYVALSRAQNKSSIVCLLSPSQVVHDVPHNKNIGYPPFVEAATGVITENVHSPTPSQTPLLPPPNPPPPPPESPHRILHNEIGDGACGFRATARLLLRDPELHLQMRQQAMQYISNNRNNHDLRIYEGINIEPLFLPLILLRGTALVSSRVSIRNHVEHSSAFIVPRYRMCLSCGISTRRLAPASPSKYWVLF